MPALLVADGAACAHDYECTSGNCVGEKNPLGGESVDGTCMAMPGQGDPCQDACAGELICDFDAAANMDVCAPAQSDGTECTLDDQCASDYCDDSTRLCAPKPETCNGM